MSIALTLAFGAIIAMLVFPPQAARLPRLVMLRRAARS